MYAKQRRRFLFLASTTGLLLPFFPLPTTQKTSCGPSVIGNDTEGSEFQYMCGTVFTPCPQEDAPISCVDPNQASPAPFTPSGSSATQLFALTVIEDLAKGMTDVVASSTSTDGTGSGTNTTTESRITPIGSLKTGITSVPILPAPTKTNDPMGSDLATETSATMKNNNPSAASAIAKIVGGMVAAVFGTVCVGIGIFLWRRRRRGLKQAALLRIPSREIFEAPVKEIQPRDGSVVRSGSGVYTYGGREIVVIRGLYELGDGVDDRARSRRWSMYI